MRATMGSVGPGSRRGLRAGSLLLTVLLIPAAGCDSPEPEPEGRPDTTFTDDTGTTSPPGDETDVPPEPMPGEESTTTGVASAPATDGATTMIGAADGCDKPLAAAGEYEAVNVLGDVEQAYWMVVPTVYEDVAPAPLYLHLASGDGGHDAFLEGWRPYLGDLDGLMAMVNTSPGAPGKRSPETMIALIDQISSNYCVDPARIHVMGTSSSAAMAEQLVCEASDLIASFIAALGSGWSGCTPDRPVPLLTFSGDPDRAGVTTLVDGWVESNGCDPDPVVEDLGSGVYRKTYENCEADVVFYDIEGMGHFWPLHEAMGPAAGYVAEYEEVDYLEEALAFFADHPLIP